MQFRITHALFACVLLSVWFLSGLFVYAQEAPTSTPARVVIPTATVSDKSIELPAIGQQPTITPTPSGGPFLEVLPDYAGNEIIHQDADPESETLGSINRGEVYEITGRIYNWIQFELPGEQRVPGEPTQGWIYIDYIEITGDETRIPDLLNTITEEAPLIGDTASDENGRIIEAPTSASNATESVVVSDTSKGSTILESQQLLATYTPWLSYVSPTPNTQSVIINAQGNLTATPIPDETVTQAILAVVEEGVPPIAVIGVLGGIGLLGMLISAIRR